MKIVIIYCIISWWLRDKIKNIFLDEINYYMIEEKHKTLDAIPLDSGKEVEEIKWSDPKYSKIFDELVNKINSSECAICAGAAVSGRIYPEWNTWIENLSKATNNPLVKKVSKMTGDEILDFMQKCFDANKIKFYDTLKNMLDPEHFQNYDPIHRYIIESPFCDILTTNVDTCLLNYLKENRLDQNNFKKELFYYPSQFKVTTLKQKNIYHIHGIFCNEKKEYLLEKAVLTKSQYAKAYKERADLRRLLGAILCEMNFVFIGSSLRDPDIRNIIITANEELKQLEEDPVDSGKICRYAIISDMYIVDKNGKRGRDKITEKDQERFCFENKIKIIRYSSKEDKYKQIEKIMHNIFVQTRNPNI